MSSSESKDILTKALSLLDYMFSDQEGEDQYDKMDQYRESVEDLCEFSSVEDLKVFYKTAKIHGNNSLNEDGDVMIHSFLQRMAKNSSSNTKEEFHEWLQTVDEHDSEFLLRLTR